jgi:hypothetical protein
VAFADKYLSAKAAIYSRCRSRKPVFGSAIFWVAKPHHPKYCRTKNNEDLSGIFVATSKNLLASKPLNYELCLETQDCDRDESEHFVFGT